MSYRIPEIKDPEQETTEIVTVPVPGNENAEPLRKPLFSLEDLQRLQNSNKKKR